MRETSFDDFFPERYSSKLEAAEDIPQIFRVVQQAAQEQMGFMRSGLKLGIVELESSQGQFIGCLHPYGTNLMVVNRLPLRRVKQAYPEICKSYLFHILLHEYLHTVGLWDEQQIHDGVFALTRKLFGADHITTKLAEDITRILPFVIYPGQMPLPEGTKVEPL